MSTLYIVIDESGNLDFSPKGTKFFVLSAISFLEPLSNNLLGEFTKIRFSLLSQGYDQQAFHASEDKQTVRDQVFNLISQIRGFDVDAVIAQKNKVHSSLYQEYAIAKNKSKYPMGIKKERVEEKFYKLISQTLVKYILKRYLEIEQNREMVDTVVILMDSMFSSNKREYIKKHMKTCIKEIYGFVPHVYFQSMGSDLNYQIADYCSWALYVKWERNETRPYEAIKQRICNEFDIFKRGTTIHY